VDTFEGRSAFSSWVYRIAVNTSFMKLRTKRNQPELSLDSLLPQFYESGYQKQMTKDWSRKTEEALLNEESKKVIHKAIDKLPEKEKVVFILRDVEEISTERVGEILGLTVPAVKSRLHRARLFLRKKLSKYFEEFQPTGQ
jgi:RNA polymerase sigma-70 factor (ECF subfamily)